MNKVSSFANQYSLTVKVFVTLVALCLFVNLIDYSATNIYNNYYGTKGIDSPALLNAIMQTTIYIKLPMLLPSIIAFYPLCLHFGDSDGSTHGCGGPLPETISITLFYAFQIILLYLFATLIARIINQTQRKY
ncbi:MAG: hypothetical protein WCT32_00410 [Patescibacteria group bacterium]|jgi:hypothetical protein